MRPAKRSVVPLVPIVVVIAAAGNYLRDLR
jgi:hypothetical protein